MQTSGLIQITGSILTPISVATAKSHANITISGDDTLVGEMLLAATEHFERVSGYHLRPVVYDWETQRALCRETALPLFPVASITSVKYLDENDVEQTVTESDYSLKQFNHPPHVLRFPEDYELPSSSKVVVRFVAGFTDPTTCPSPIKQAIKFLVAHWYENREAYLEDKLAAVPAAWESIVMSATDHQFA